MAPSEINTVSQAEIQAAEALLADAWGEPVTVRAAEPVLDRTHVFRLRVTTDRSVIIKKRVDGQDEGYGAEVAALEYLNGMPEPVAPRLLGADADAGIMVMEDLGPGASLADSLLTGDPSRVRADLVSYAQALGAMHAWSMSRPPSSRPRGVSTPAWLGAVTRGKAEFLGAAAALGLASDGAATDIDELSLILNGPRYHGLVHGDACPDNERIAGGRCLIFDFEHSGWGSVALDASYLLAPFPSCWCFGRLPAEVATPAMSAYRACLQAAGIELGPSWDACMAAALGAWVVARGGLITRVLEEDSDEWGTTTMRPRLLAWLRSFTSAAALAGVLPRLAGLCGEMHNRLAARWPQTVIADYPALARPGSARVTVPGWWQPRA